MPKTYVLTHNQYPELRIVVPGTGEVRQFLSSGGDRPYGTMVINDEDPNFETIMAVAQKDPGISIQSGDGATTKASAKFTCPIDGQGFKTEAELVKHTRKEHAPDPEPDTEIIGDVPAGAVVSEPLSTTNSSTEIPAARSTGQA